MAAKVLWRTYPDGDSVGSSTTPWTYGAAGRLDTVPGVVTDTQYEADGQTSFIAYANTATTTFTYDPDRRWLDEIETGNTGGLLQRLTYLRDAVGRITNVFSSPRVSESWNYTYDTLDRLRACRCHRR